MFWPALKLGDWRAVEAKQNKSGQERKSGKERRGDSAGGADLKVDVVCREGRSNQGLL